MHHPGALIHELDLLHRQARQPEEQGRILPAHVVLNHLNLRTLNQARDLTFVTMNCLDNSHDHRGHGPYRVTTQGTRARSSSKSRMTGLWQVSGRSDLSWEDTVRLDLYYVDNWSILRDMAILARTMHAVLSSRGAY